MKRVNKKVEGMSQNFGFKKGRFLNGNVESSRKLESSENEESRVFTENVEVDSATVDINGKLSGNIVPDNSGDPNFGGLKESTKFSGNEEGHNVLGFDLNYPVVGSNENRVNIIDIASENSDDETETGGSNFGYEAKSKEAEVVMSYDRMENLNLKWGISKMENVVGENTLATTNEHRYTREEEGKDSVHDVGPSQKSDLIDLNVPTIDIVSGNGNNEAEVRGCDMDYESNGKEIEVGMSDDWTEILNPEPGITKMDSVVGERTLLPGDRQRDTKEGKVKSSIADAEISQQSDLDDSSVSSESDELIAVTEPTEDVVIRSGQPVALPARPELPERAPQTTRMVEMARSLARGHLYESDGKKSISQTRGPLSMKSVEQLGTSPGPFSAALEKVRTRTLKRETEQLFGWNPSVANKDRGIPALVPSLLDLSLKVLAENAEAIISLEVVPDNLRRRLVDLLCDMGKINACILNLLVKGCPTEIRIKNCSWLTEEQLQQSLESCQTDELRVLQLDLCGQCMFDFVFSDALPKSSINFSSLADVSLRGACRLSDNGLKQLVTSAPSLRSINLGYCTLLTCDAINFIADSLGSNLVELNIDDCQKIDTALILPAIKKFTCLEVLSVAGIHTVTDQFISKLVAVCGKSIKELDLANCQELSDISLKTIGSSCTGLCSLNIENLHNLTDLGMEYLANGCRSIRKLKLSGNGFSDEALAAFLETSGESLVELSLNKVMKAGPSTALSLARHSRKLLCLDISWCREISNEALGLIVDSCLSLKLLKVFGCRQITNVFLHGHSNPLVRVIGLKLTPVLDHLNLYGPEDVFLR